MSYLEKQMDRDVVRCEKDVRESVSGRLCCLRKVKERGGETTNWRYVFQRKVHVMRLRVLDTEARCQSQRSSIRMLLELGY